MTFQPGAVVGTQGFGNRPENIEVPHIDVRDPSISDTNYPLGKRWLNRVLGKEFVLGNFSTSNGITSANWGFLGSSVGGYPSTPYVVGPSGQAGYQTIQAAVNAAQAAGSGIVVVQPGTYTENLTLYNGIHITGLTFADAGGGVNIVGVHTPPATGGFVFNNVALQSLTHIFNSSVAGTAHLVIGNAAITVTNGYTFNLSNWTGKLETYDVNDRGSTNDGFINNSGGSEIAIFSAAVGAGSGNVMTLSGVVSIFGSAIGCPINLITGADFFLEENVHLAPITFSNNSTGEITLSEIDAQIVMSSSGSVLIANSLINSSSSPAINGAGAGVLQLTTVSFLDDSTVANTLTISHGNTVTGQLLAGSDTGGVEGYTSITSGESTTIAAGDGAIKMSSGNPGTNAAWIKIYIGTVAHWIPAWTTNSP